MKTFLVLIILTASLWWLNSCDSGVGSDPHSFIQTPWEPVLLGAYPLGDGSTKYQVLLPSVYEKGFLNDEKWDYLGIQLQGEEQIRPLYGAQNQEAYYYEFITVNKNLFFNYGWFKRSGDTIMWANHKAGLNNGWYLGDYFGITFLNSAISKVNQADLVKLTAVIDADGAEVSEGTSIHFSGVRSTGQAMPESHIVQYTWYFGDDRSSAVGAEVNHMFNTRGDYQVQLVVQDDLGRTSSAIVNIKVFKMAFPENTLPGGDKYIQVIYDRINQTATICVNLSLTRGNHGRPFWWGTDNGVGTAWIFHGDIPTMFLNEDWGNVTLPCDGHQQYEFTYSDFYSYFDYANNQVSGVNWDHVGPQSKFFRAGARPEDGHFAILVSNGELSFPY